MKGLKLTSLLEKIDRFGRPLPAFNLKGETKVHTVTGGLVTFLILVTTLSYGALKFYHLLTNHNANVTSVLETDVFDFTETTNLHDIGFRVAFSVRGYNTQELKDDPRYVKYLIRMFGKKDGKEFERLLPYHKCTDEDWKEFTPPSKAFSDSFSAIKNGDVDGMYCLDWTDDVEPILIYGNEKNDEYQRVELVLVPCNYVHTRLGYDGDSVTEECLADKDKMIEYLGPIEFLMYFTQETFIQKVFDEQTIQKNSMFFNQQVSETIPNWI